MDKENCKLETKMPAANSVPERPIRYLRPIGDKVLVRLKERESRIGSIIIPDSAQKENCWGEIVALGTAVDADISTWTCTTLFISAPRRARICFTRSFGRL